LAFFFQLGEDEPFLAKSINDLLLVSSRVPLVRTSITTPLDLATMLPNDVTNAFYSFNGSLTTPPCYESVRWVIADTPLNISNLLLNVIRLTLTTAPAGVDPEPLGGNFRPLQPVNDRDIFCAWEGCNFTMAETTTEEPVVHTESSEETFTQDEFVGSIIGASIGLALLMALCLFVGLRGKSNDAAPSYRTRPPTDPQLDV
jgi:hypothetical protein